jgi:hypothetical protein
MSSGKSRLAMQAVAKRPHDAISESQAVVFEFVVQKNIERVNLAVINPISDLPADRSSRVQKPISFGYSR